MVVKTKKNSPKLKIKVVTTINGDKEYRRNCKYIKGNYYVIDQDCFFVAERWYRKDSGKLIKKRSDDR